MTSAAKQKFNFPKIKPIKGPSIAKNVVDRGNKNNGIIINNNSSGGVNIKMTSAHKAKFQLNKLVAWHTENNNSNSSKKDTKIDKNSHNDDNDNDDNDDDDNDNTDAAFTIADNFMTNNSAQNDDDGNSDEDVEFSKKSKLYNISVKVDELYRRAVTDLKSNSLFFLKTAKITKKSHKVSFIELNKIEKTPDYLYILLYLIFIYVRDSPHKYIYLDCKDFVEERKFLEECNDMSADYIRSKCIIWGS